MTYRSQHSSAQQAKAILCFGEALIDFISHSAITSDGLRIAQFGQYPGGAPANAAVAVAKLGGVSRFIGQVGQDSFGYFLRDALQHYGVCTQYLALHPTAKTALAFVAHDAEGERSFSFYRQQSADMVFSQEQISAEMFQGATVLHFCSNTLVNSDIADVTAALLQQAAQQGLWLSFDVNLRHNLWPAGVAERTVVRQFLAMAQVVKFSHDELLYLTDTPEQYIGELLAGQAQLVVVTHDDKPLRYYLKTSAYQQGLASADKATLNNTNVDNSVLSGVMPVPQVTVVDTTAGGDAFIGGLLYQLSLQPDLPQFCRDIPALEHALAFAARCGAHAVTRHGAFPALPTLAAVADDRGV